MREYAVSLGKVAVLIDKQRQRVSRIKVPREIECDFALLCDTDRMAPAIPAGALVYVRAQTGVKEGEIAAIYAHGRYYLKRVYHMRDCVMLKDDDPHATPMYHYAGDEGVYIVGKAVAFMQEVK